MAFFVNGAQPRSARPFVQAWHAPAWFKLARRLGPACLACVAGCSNYHTTGPEAWWHEAIGGKIAQERPPPPGDKDPFPNLATVPAKPPPANTAEWNQRTAGLVTDRIKANQAAALAPIPPAVAGTAASVAPGTQSPEPGASAALAATTPPQTKPAPAVPVPTIAKSDNAAERVANGQLPALPGQEPARPDFAPGPPPPLVPLTATPPPAQSPAGTAVDFSRGSAVLNDPALTEVKALAASRGDLGIAVTGYGDATSSDPLAQSDALGLGLSRAQALATALVAQGVPFARLRLNAEAAGRGASLRLLE